MDDVLGGKAHEHGGKQHGAPLTGVRRPVTQPKLSPIVQPPRKGPPVRRDHHLKCA